MATDAVHESGERPAGRTLVLGALGGMLAGMAMAMAMVEMLYGWVAALGMTAGLFFSAVGRGRATETPPAELRRAA